MIYDFDFAHMKALNIGGGGVVLMDRTLSTKFYKMSHGAYTNQSIHEV